MAACTCIRKCFGTIGSYNHDFETFAKSATESGINVSDRALLVTPPLKKTAAGNVNIAGRYDTFAMCDCIIYLHRPNGQG
jgi:hypothetical protein